jgi:hypothetical protein
LLSPEPTPRRIRLLQQSPDRSAEMVVRHSSCGRPLLSGRPPGQLPGLSWVQQGFHLNMAPRKPQQNERA